MGDFHPELHENGFSEFSFIAPISNNDEATSLADWLKILIPFIRAIICKKPQLYLS
jgi:hypothetical protein